MSEKKKLIVNCELCDARKMKEEDYSHYESMILNTDILLVSETTKGILQRLPVIINSDKTLEMEENREVQVKTVNGDYTITGDMKPGEQTMLVVNGSLTIETGAGEALEKYQFIVVNGSVTCPRSLGGYTENLSVNGSVIVYPDGYKVLGKKYVMDKYFPLRAKENGRYFVKNTVIIPDEEVDVDKLAEKQIQFLAKTLIVPERRVEACACIFDETTDFVVVPSGTKLITKNVVLNQKLIKKEGNALFVYGDLKVDEKADLDALADQIEKLIVKGKVSVKECQLDAFYRLDAEYGKLEILDNRYEMKNLAIARISSDLLMDAEEGVRVLNAAKVTIDSDVEPKMILEKLQLKNCGKVSCTEDQESAVAAVSENVGHIGENAEGSMVGDMFDAVKGIANTRIINAERYVM